MSDFKRQLGDEPHIDFFFFMYAGMGTDQYRSSAGCEQPNTCGNLNMLKY